MSSRRLDTRQPPTSSTDAGFEYVLRTLRWTLYACLAVLRPLVLLGLAAVAAVALLSSAFYGFLMHASHFPFGFVLVLALGAAIGGVLFNQLVNGLRPK
jgi:uncharacterized integral membrane protein